MDSKSEPVLEIKKKKIDRCCEAERKCTLITEKQTITKALDCIPSFMVLLLHWTSRALILTALWSISSVEIQVFWYRGSKHQNSHQQTDKQMDGCYQMYYLFATIKKASIIHNFTHLTTQSASVKFWKNRPFSFLVITDTFLAQGKWKLWKLNNEN